MKEPKNNLDRPKPDERVCYNCKNMLWMVGIGQGVRCGLSHPPKLIPQLRHTCDYFKFRTEE